MDFLKQNKMAIGIGALLLVGIFVYMSFFAAPGTSATLTASGNDAALSQSLLVTLQNLHTIKLDNSIFADASFISLTDFGVTIPAELIGRRNPFLPTGLGKSSASAGGVKLPNLSTH